MSTEEWIARGALGVLSFIVLIIWLRWEGPREDQKKDSLGRSSASVEREELCRQRSYLPGASLGGMKM
jgi:hypothetical protein